MDSEYSTTNAETLSAIGEGEEQVVQDEELEPQADEDEQDVEQEPDQGDPGPEEEEESYEFTEDEVKDMRRAFQLYDLVKGDAVPLRCLGSLLRGLGLNPSQGLLRQHAEWLDASLVPFKQFLIIMGRTLKESITEEDVLEGFRCLDDDLGGAVPCDRLRDVLTSSGERFDPKEIALFIKHADPRSKGVVQYEDFVKRMSDLAVRGGGKQKKKKKKKGKKRRKGAGRESDGSDILYSTDD